MPKSKFDKKSGGPSDNSVQKNTPSRWWHRPRKVLFFFVAGLLFAPYILIIIYKINFIHPVSTLMLADLFKGTTYQRQWVSIDEISPAIIQSILMSEDGQYCAHNGVDWTAINSVIENAIDGEKTRGASTLAMQSAKNLFLWPGRSYVRKALELPLALAADFIWSKRRLMEIYLNVVELGPGIYGVEAASQKYFGRKAKNANRNQAALLAAALPNPYIRSLRKPNRKMRLIARKIKSRANQSGAYIKCIYPKK